MNAIKKNIPYENLKKLNEPFVESYKKAFGEFLDSGWYILGKGVNTFEENFSKFCKANHFCGLASGLDALTIALKVYGFKAGSEVLVPSNTYIATILAIVNNNLKPILVEPDIATYNIDPAKLQAAITPNTVAIMPVHLYGKCCDMKAIMQIAKTHKLKVIEDVAQAHGALQHGKMAGTFGDFGAFSFYPTKNLGALGDAGGLCTDDYNLDKQARLIRNYGSSVKYYNEVSGINSRLDDLQARFLDIKLQSMNEINNHKRLLAQRYLQNLSSNFILPVVDTDYYDVYHIFNIRTPHRDALKSYLLEHGIGTEIHYPVPPHKQQAMRTTIEGNYPISEEIHATTLSLPISYCHSIEDIDYVISVINEFNN
jgi:dTDP-4-amino-4,6-dideoxygalactose transaminase